MSLNTIREFWERQSARSVVTQGQIDDIKRRFGVDGDVIALADHPGYAISDGGRVFSTVPCSHAHDGVRELRCGRTGAGYPTVHLHDGKRAMSRHVHRLVAEIFLPPPAPGQRVVRHLDGDPKNNRRDNLAWGTQAENLADMIRHGRSLKGFKHPHAKLTPRRVEIIRLMEAEGFSRQIVASLFGVSETSIISLVSGLSYEELP